MPSLNYITFLSLIAIKFHPDLFS